MTSFWRATSAGARASRSAARTSLSVSAVGSCMVPRGTGLRLAMLSARSDPAAMAGHAHHSPRRRAHDPRSRMRCLPLVLVSLASARALVLALVLSLGLLLLLVPVGVPALAQIGRQLGRHGCDHDLPLVVAIPVDPQLAIRALVHAGQDHERQAEVRHLGALPGALRRPHQPQELVDG